MSPRAEIEIAPAGERTALIFRGCVDVAAASALRDRLLEVLAEPRDLAVSLEAVERLDATGVQLLCALKRAVERSGRAFEVAIGEGAARRAIEAAGAAIFLAGETR